MRHFRTLASGDRKVSNRPFSDIPPGQSQRPELAESRTTAQSDWRGGADIRVRRVEWQLLTKRCSGAENSIRGYKLQCVLADIGKRLHRLAIDSATPSRRHWAVIAD